MRGRRNLSQLLPFSPVVFWLLASSLARRPTEPCLPAGQGAGNSRRKSATKERRREIPAPQAPTKEGLDGVERTPRIRRTATRKRRRQTGPGSPELCDGAPWTQQPAAKRTPIHWLKHSGNQGEPCEPAFALGLVRLGWYGGIVPPGSPNPRRDILCQKERWTVGLRSFFTRRRAPAAAEPSAVLVATEREPLTPAQLADLEAAWAELQQAT